MLVLESWLREIANPSLSNRELADCLTMAGLEVEGVEPLVPTFSGVVVAQIKEIEQHPNADKLRICQVDVGKEELLTIVCGAPNAAKGIKVPLAMIGAVLPGNIKIGKSKLRGQASFGMLCSARELGISDDSTGLLILDDNARVGQDIRDALQLDDQVFEIKLTPNRADCLSMYGVGREVSALTSTPLKSFDFSPVPVTITDTLKVNVQAPDLCGRFAGRVIRGVNARAQTPSWMKKRLQAVGQRSVSALVDISNYVMLELGRPTHIFDYDKIQGDLTVRWSQVGETLTLLNGETVDLSSKMGVIVAGDTIESLAGIMGGQDTAVSLDTQAIYVEAAFWHPEAIAGHARALKIPSEASHRFERGVDFQLLPEHLDYISALILHICGGQAGAIDDQILQLPERHPVDMRWERCNKILGIHITKEEIHAIFTRLGFSFVEKDGVFTVTPASFRFDIAIEEDLIEEVARVYGFDRIPAQAPFIPSLFLPHCQNVLGEHDIRHNMVARGYQEVINFSFVEKEWEEKLLRNSHPIALLNPISSQLSVMRSGLVPSLVANIAYNSKRKQSRVKIFELARTFKYDDTVQNGPLSLAHIEQTVHLAGAAWGLAYPEQWGMVPRNVDFFDVKNDIQVLFAGYANALRFVPAEYSILHPGRSADILLGSQSIGYLGELHPQWVQYYELAEAPIVFEIVADVLKAKKVPVAQEISKQPAVIRDLAVWVSDCVPVQEMLAAIQFAKQSVEELAIIQEITLFDVWRDTSGTLPERSLAFRFVLQEMNNTLEDAVVEKCIEKVLAVWVDKFSVRQR